MGDEAGMGPGCDVGAVPHADLEVVRLGKIPADEAEAGGFLGDSSDLMDHVNLSEG